METPNTQAGWFTGHLTGASTKKIDLPTHIYNPIWSAVFEWFESRTVKNPGGQSWSNTESLEKALEEKGDFSNQARSYISGFFPSL